MVRVQVHVRMLDRGGARLGHLRLEQDTPRALPPHFGPERLSGQHRRRESRTHRLEARCVAAAHSFRHSVHGEAEQPPKLRARASGGAASPPGHTGRPGLVRRRCSAVQV